MHTRLNGTSTAREPGVIDLGSILVTVDLARGVLQSQVVMQIFHASYWPNSEYRWGSSRNQITSCECLDEPGRSRICYLLPKLWHNIVPLPPLRPKLVRMLFDIFLKHSRIKIFVA
jgi:hypothetical protein